MTVYVSAILGSLMMRWLEMQELIHVERLSTDNRVKSLLHTEEVRGQEWNPHHRHRRTRSGRAVEVLGDERSCRSTLSRSAFSSTSDSVFVLSAPRPDSTI